MARLAISVSLAGLDRKPRALLDLAATWKVDGVQLDVARQARPAELGETARREFRHRLGERRLSVSGLLFPVRSSVAAEDRLDARIAALLDAMQLARDLGAKSVVVKAGPVPPAGEGDAPNRDRDRMGQVLAELAVAGDRVGVVPTLLPAPGSLPALADVVARVDSAPLAIQLDPAAAVLGGDDLEAAARVLHPHLRQLRVRDAQRLSDGAGEETVCGRGEVDWDLTAALSGELRELKWLVADRTEGLDRVGDLGRAVSFARRVFGLAAE